MSTSSDKGQQEPPSLYALIANDDPVILSVLTHALEQEGFKVCTVRDGNQCLQMVLLNCPDVLMVDWNTPGINGTEICRQMRDYYMQKILPHYTYIFVVSEQKDRKIILECLDAGADDFIEISPNSSANLHIEIKSRLKAALRTRKLEQDLEFAAKYDSLTTLLNRITFFELAQGIWNRSIRNDFPLSAIMFDCDFFKRVNDVFGHSAGDTVLRTMAMVLKDFSRASDIVCRYGGEEFCVLLPGCNEKTAWNWAERIRKQFEVSPVRYENIDIKFTVSFGIAQRSEGMVTLDKLIKCADQALIFAKQAGRNCCVRFSETIYSGIESVLSNGLFNLLFEDVSAGDTMTPFSLSLNENETISATADFFLNTSIEALPVVNNEGNLLGVVSQKNLIALIGDIERWHGTISGLVEPSIISYPSETPLRYIYDFFCRVSTSQILILENKKPAGFISRSSLLRWLRNQWAAISGDCQEIIPTSSVNSFGHEHIADVMKELSNEIEKIRAIYSSENSDEYMDAMRVQMVTIISQVQDIMETVLRDFCAQNTAAGNLSRLKLS
ncbi:MAG: diguanylate cyclase [Planctomycetaceae bacterium]|nr:diguanylate cyclase [Planctomycetaceae bacterium]